MDKLNRGNKKNLGKRCAVLLGSADDLPLKDSSVKLATAFEPVCFWKSLKKCFAEVKRVLETDGEFVVVNDRGNPEKHW